MGPLVDQNMQKKQKMQGGGGQPSQPNQPVQPGQPPQQDPNQAKPMGKLSIQGAAIRQNKATQVPANG